MFGLVMANVRELPKEQQSRYGAVYCGICRQIRNTASQPARMALQYDMAFLALLLMSLYEPEERGGGNACILHPIRHRPWLDSEFIRYAADMNVVLAYYKAMDDRLDEKSLKAKTMMAVFSPSLPQIRQRWPRQCQAIARGVQQLRQLEQADCPDPDAPAGCFGELMAELLVYKEDLWAPTLRQVGLHLGRFIYLTDAALDYRRDKRRGSYNPFLAMGTGEDWPRWEKYLLLAMGRCTQAYERLPLVQDKALLDNILYSGIWIEYRRRQRLLRVEPSQPAEEKHD